MQCEDQVLQVDTPTVYLLCLLFAFSLTMASVMSDFNDISELPVEKVFSSLLDRFPKVLRRGGI